MITMFSYMEFNSSFDRLTRDELMTLYESIVKSIASKQELVRLCEEHPDMMPDDIHKRTIESIDDSKKMITDIVDRLVELTIKRLWIQRASSKPQLIIEHAPPANAQLVEPISRQVENSLKITQ